MQMAKNSAGVLMYRWREKRLEVFLVHPGGPFWAKKDSGSWSIPKGEFAVGEDALAAAQREFREETGLAVVGVFTPLTPIRQTGGKTVHAWVIEGDCDSNVIKSNTYSMEWPPKSLRFQDFPEVDRADWFTIDSAKKKIVKGQVGLLEELQRILTKEVSLLKETQT
jgi:predicted NUDIX family NTP pyrophosphohydrolase